MDDCNVIIQESLKNTQYAAISLQWKSHSMFLQEALIFLVTNQSSCHFIPTKIFPKQVQIIPQI